MACVNEESRLSFSASNSGRYLLSPTLLLRLMLLLFASILLTAYGTSAENSNSRRRRVVLEMRVEAFLLVLTKETAANGAGGNDVTLRNPLPFSKSWGRGADCDWLVLNSAEKSNRCQATML